MIAFGNLLGCEEWLDVFSAHDGHKQACSMNRSTSRYHKRRDETPL
jgi:hypothetical protein